METHYHYKFTRYMLEPHLEKWNGFPELMWELGFEMDCYRSFEEHYMEPYEEFETETDRQDWIIERLQESPTQIVGNYIFSRYRQLTHWCDYGYSYEVGEYFFQRAFPLLEYKLHQDKHENDEYRYPL